MRILRNLRARAGFTILEVVTVLVIIAIGTALAVPAFREFFRQDDLTEATYRIDALFRLARDSAVRSGHPVTVVIDSTSNLVWLDADVPPALDDAVPSPLLLRSTSPARMMGPQSARNNVFVPGESIELPASVRMELSRARARFTFVPSGTAFADSLLLRGPQGVVLITVDRWTGDMLAY